MKKTIYLDTARHGLLSVKFLGWTETPLGLGFNATLRIQRKNKLYDVGEVVRVPAWSVVEKVCVRNYKQIVRPALLPVRTEVNTLKKPNYFFN